MDNNRNYLFCLFFYGGEINMECFEKKCAFMVYSSKQNVQQHVQNQ